MVSLHCFERGRPESKYNRFMLSKLPPLRFFFNKSLMITDMEMKVCLIFKRTHGIVK